MADVLLELVRGLRQDVAAMRREVADTREQAAATRQRIDAVAAELSQHREDDRRELYALAGDLDEQRRRLTAARVGGWRLLAVAAVGWPAQWWALPGRRWWPR